MNHFTYIIIEYTTPAYVDNMLEEDEVVVVDTVTDTHHNLALMA